MAESEFSVTDRAPPRDEHGQPVVPVTRNPRPGPDNEAEQAFEAVYLEHHDFVWRCVRAMGVPAHAVDDVTQDVFMIVHARLPQFDHRAPVRAWIYGIARNRARKHHARQGRPRPHLHLVHGRAPSEPEEAVALRQAAQAVQSFLDRLDPDKREVFVLARLQGLSVPEIAQMLGIKLNTAYSRLRAARLAFERHLSRLQAAGRRER